MGRPATALRSSPLGESRTAARPRIKLVVRRGVATVMLGDRRTIIIPLMRTARTDHLDRDIATLSRRVGGPVRGLA